MTARSAATGGRARRPMVMIAAVAVAALVVLGVIGALPSAAQGAPPAIDVELLTGRATFTDDVRAQLRVKLDGRGTTVMNLPDPSRTVVARLTVQPGAQFPWHTHEGPVIVNVVEGELVYVNADDCVQRAYPAETVFVDPGRGNVHTAFNPPTTSRCSWRRSSRRARRVR